MEKQIPLRTLVREILPCLQAADTLAKITLKPTIPATTKQEEQQRKQLQDDFLPELSRIRMHLAPLLSRHAAEVRAIHNNRASASSMGTIVTMNEQQLRLLNSVHTLYARILRIRDHKCFFARSNAQPEDAMQQAEEIEKIKEMASPADILSRPVQQGNNNDHSNKL